MITLFKNSILAGVYIALAGFMYLTVDNKYIGAFLFSLGLLIIINKKLALYTGKIYDLNTKNIKEKLIILSGNIVGAFCFTGLPLRYSNLINTTVLWESKLQHSIVQILLLSIICGILMYTAVSLFTKTNNPLYVIMSIMIFILSGSEHCIANIFYLSLTNITYKHIIYILINIIGNTIGSVIVYKLDNT